MDNLGGDATGTPTLELISPTGAIINGSSG